MTAPFGPGFSYGYDYATLQPVTSSPFAAGPLAVAKTIPAHAAICSMGWGTGNPEPSPGDYNFKSIGRQVAFALMSGATPIITLCGAPDWMKGGEEDTTDWANLEVPPLPDYFDDFASLCAKIAAEFTQVKHFVVWKELAGLDIEEYVELFNLVCAAIKAVRPDAFVGGPYASMHSLEVPVKTAVVSGPWGHLASGASTDITYWLAHQVGADFIAVDGRAFTQDAGLITDPITSTQKYADVSTWIIDQTDLPLVWMESHLVPNPSQYSAQGQASFRVAALIHMASANVALGMQWDPENSVTWDQGLWVPSSTTGLPTALATVLPAVLEVLAGPTPAVSWYPGGRVGGWNDVGTIVATSPPAGVVVSSPRRDSAPG